MNLDRFGALDNLVQFWGSSPGVLFKHAFLFKSAFCCSSCETSTVNVPNSSPFSWSPPHCPSSFCVRYGGDRSPENKGTSKWGKPTNIEQPSWWFQKISEKEERETLEVNAHVGWGLFTKQQSPQLTWIYFKKKEKFRALPLVAQQNQHKKLGVSHLIHQGSHSQHLVGKTLNPWDHWSLRSKFPRSGHPIHGWRLDDARRYPNDFGHWRYPISKWCIAVANPNKQLDIPNNIPSYNVAPPS